MSREDVEALEKVLHQILKWGKFQVWYYLCLGFAVVFSVFTMNYIFVARDIKYRCFIPECDPESPKSVKFEAQFLKNFVPYTGGFPDRCLRYDFGLMRNNISQNILNMACNPFNDTDHKYVRVFNETMRCNRFIFERSETTIVHDFNLLCEENLWKLTMVGTINVVGELVSLSYSGFLSDRYGRKTVLVMNLLLSSICGITKSFSVNYYMFIAFEFLDTALGGAMYGATFVLAMELVTAKDRNIGNTAISCTYALGQVVFGIIAWLSPNWRTMIRIMYFPGVLSIAIWFFLPESVRWLLSKNRVQEANDILTKIAKINGRQLSRDEIEIFQKGAKGVHLEQTDVLDDDLEISGKEENSSFMAVIRNPVLLLRTIHCSMTWVCCTFVFYGLTIHSVDISKNIYLSFIFAAVAETPGYVIYYYANEKSGRRKLMASTLVLGGIFCLAVGFLPEGWFKLMAFFGGKCCLTIAYTVLYVYTTELFPTCSRHAMFSICSMFGRIGSMIAPQIPMLARISRALPLILFSIMSLTFGFLALLLPETSHIPLPHTAEEALNIGKRKPKAVAIEDH